jgi:hypothetical protein
MDWQLVRKRIVEEDGDNSHSAIPCCNFTAHQPFPVKVMHVGRYFTLLGESAYHGFVWTNPQPPARCLSEHHC